MLLAREIGRTRAATRLPTLAPRPRTGVAAARALEFARAIMARYDDVIARYRSVPLVHLTGLARLAGAREAVVQRWLALSVLVDLRLLTPGFAPAGPEVRASGRRQGSAGVLVRLTTVKERLRAAPPAVSGATRATARAPRPGPFGAELVRATPVFLATSPGAHLCRGVPLPAPAAGAGRLRRTAAAAGWLRLLPVPAPATIRDPGHRGDLPAIARTGRAIGSVAAPGLQPIPARALLPAAADQRRARTASAPAGASGDQAPPDGHLRIGRRRAAARADPATPSSAPARNGGRGPFAMVAAPARRPEAEAGRSLDHDRSRALPALSDLVAGPPSPMRGRAPRPAGSSRAAAAGHHPAGSFAADRPTPTPPRPDRYLRTLRVAAASFAPDRPAGDPATGRFQPILAAPVTAADRPTGDRAPAPFSFLRILPAPVTAVAGAAPAAFPGPVMARAPARAEPRPTGPATAPAGHPAAPAFALAARGPTATRPFLRLFPAPAGIAPGLGRQPLPEPMTVRAAGPGRMPPAAATAGRGRRAVGTSTRAPTAAAPRFLRIASAPALAGPDRAGLSQPGTLPARGSQPAPGRPVAAGIAERRAGIVGWPGAGRRAPGRLARAPASGLAPDGAPVPRPSATSAGRDLRSSPPRGPYAATYAGGAGPAPARGPQPRPASLRARPTAAPASVFAAAGPGRASGGGGGGTSADLGPPMVMTATATSRLSGLALPIPPAEFLADLRPAARRAPGRRPDAMTAAALMLESTRRELSVRRPAGGRPPVTSTLVPAVLPGRARPPAGSPQSAGGPRPVPAGAPGAAEVVRLRAPAGRMAEVSTLADAVYRLIVDRVRREKQMRGL